MSGQKIPVSVLVVLHDPKGRVLLIERVDRPGYWQSVTGSLDRPDEDLVAAACREVQEETGWVVASCSSANSADLRWPHSDLGQGVASRHAPSDAASAVFNANLNPLSQPCWHLLDWQIYSDYEIYEHWRHRYPPGVTQNREHVFSLCVPEASVPRLAPREHQAYVWLDANEAAQRCFSPSNAVMIRAMVSDSLR